MNKIVTFSSVETWPIPETTMWNASISSVPSHQADPVKSSAILLNRFPSRYVALPRIERQFLTIIWAVLTAYLKIYLINIFHKTLAAKVIEI